MNQESRKMNIVVICGGTGGYTVLSGIKHFFDVYPQAIVTMADNGGSTGALRTTMGVLPPGDIRRALVALSDQEETWLKVFTYRFEGAAENHVLGNLIIAALEKTFGGDFAKAIREVKRILRVRGNVIPVTLNHVHLHAEREDGTVVDGETNIDLPKNFSYSKIARIWLDPTGVINPEAREAILRADLVVIGPGDIYTSLVPNLLVKGMREAIAESKAKKAYVVNIMTKHGETDGFDSVDFVNIIRRYVGQDVLTHVLYNNIVPAEEALTAYRNKEKAEFVAYKKTMPATLETIEGDFIAEGELVRHDALKLAHALVSLVD